MDIEEEASVDVVASHLSKVRFIPAGTAQLHHCIKHLHTTTAMKLLFLFFHRRLTTRAKALTICGNAWRKTEKPPPPAAAVWLEGCCCRFHDIPPEFRSRNRGHLVPSVQRLLTEECFLTSSFSFLVLTCLLVCSIVSYSLLLPLR